MNETKSILFADDELEICAGAQMWLSRAGYHTHLAHDGEQAVTEAARLRPDAIVLDVRMPNRDGLSSLAELNRKSETRHIPVVMLSASLHDQQAALDAGARFFLTKPYEPKALIAAVGAAIEQATLASPSRGAHADANENDPDCGR